MEAEFVVVVEAVVVVPVSRSMWSWSTCRNGQLIFVLIRHRLSSTTSSRVAAAVGLGPTL